MKIFSLNNIIDLFLSDSSLNSKTEISSHFLMTGLHQFLLILISIELGGLLHSKSVPRGLTCKLAESLQKPNLGDLYELLKWLSAQIKCSSLEKLNEFLIEYEYKKNGWLSQLIHHRNLITHPEEETPDQVKEQTARIIFDPPDFRRLGVIHIDSSNSITWLCDNRIHSLAPFLSWEKGYIRS